MRFTVIGSLALALAAATSLAAQSADLANGIKLYEAKQAPQAKVIFTNAIKANPSDARAASYLGRIAFDAGNYDEAADWFSKAVAIEPRRGEHYRLLGGAYGRQAQKANKFRQAMLARKTINAWDKAVELDPNDIEARLDRIQFYRQAPAFMGGGMDKAYAEAEEIRTRDPYRGLFSTMNLYVAEKKWPEAERTALRMAREQPDSLTSHLVLGYVYQAEQQWEKAFAFFEPLTKSANTEALAQYQIGRSGAMSGLHLDRAEQALRQYLQRTPKPNEPPPAAARFRLGQIYERQGAQARARAEYESALQLDPKHTEAAAALKRMKA